MVHKQFVCDPVVISAAIESSPFCYNILYRFQGQREEGANYNIRVPVCVELPVVTSHGSTQPDDGSCIRDSATVYLPPMHTKVVFAHTAVMLLSCGVLQVVCDQRRLEPLDLS